jgi:hypothetical protein
MVILGLSTIYQVTKVHRFCKNMQELLSSPAHKIAQMTQNFKPQTKKSTLGTYSLTKKTFCSMKKHLVYPWYTIANPSYEAHVKVANMILY